MPSTLDNPWIVPLGDAGLLVRFATALSEAANSRAVAFARILSDGEPIAGVIEIVPSLVSVLLRYDPATIGFDALAGEVRLRIGQTGSAGRPQEWEIAVRFDGEDLAEVAGRLGMSVEAFVAAHNARPVRVLATGFAPGFVYCGFHPETLRVARRETVRPRVAAGTVLFAAGQTAIAATPIPTGWHVIGRTQFCNFVPDASPPTRLRAGDKITFRVAE